MQASLFDTYNFFQCKTSEKLQQRKYKIKDSYIGTYTYILKLNHRLKHTQMK